MKRVAAVLAEKWNKPYGVVMCWVRVRLQFALIRAVDLRLRGSTKAFHGFGMMDEAGMGLVYYGFELAKELYVCTTVCVYCMCVG